MKRDPEEFAAWALLIGAILFAAILLVAFGYWISVKMLEVDDKRECRAAGRVVVELEASNWKCVSPTPERAP